MTITPAQGYRIALTAADRALASAGSTLIAASGAETVAVAAARSEARSQVERGVALISLASGIGSIKGAQLPVLRLNELDSAASTAREAAALIGDSGSAADDAMELLYAARRDAGEAATAPSQAHAAGKFEVDKLVEGVLAWPKMTDEKLGVSLGEEGRAALVKELAAAPVPAADDISAHVTSVAKYGSNISAAARADMLKPVLGRDAEIQQMIEVLTAPGGKNNVALLGGAGVGKTALLEGLAQRIAEGNVPRELRNAEIVAIEPGKIVGGSKYVGVTEGRMQEVISGMSASNGRIIGFVDEMHMLVGLGQGANGNSSSANLLKPALARDGFRMIGATTDDEFSIVASDPAFARRFKEVHLEPLTPMASIEVLRSITPSLTAHNGVTVGADAFDAAVRLSVERMPHRNLPDKAIDVLQQTIAHVAGSKGARPAKLDLLDRDIIAATQRLQSLEATRGATPAQVAEARGALGRLTDEYAVLSQTWSGDVAALDTLAARQRHVADVEAVIAGLEKSGDASGAERVRNTALAQASAKLAAQEETVAAIRVARPDFFKSTVTADDVEHMIGRMTAGAERRSSSATPVARRPAAAPGTAAGGEQAVSGRDLLRAVGGGLKERVRRAMTERGNAG